VLAQRGVVLADPAGEHQGVQAADHRHAAADLLDEPVQVHVERQHGGWIPAVGAVQHLAHVADPHSPCSPLSRSRTVPTSSPVRAASQVTAPGPTEPERAPRS
jgi:hypothetical protein